MTIENILQRLKDGNARFVAEKSNHDLQDRKRRKHLDDCGQEPYVIILSCADSRVAPELTFDMGLGEIFVIRVAGNIANTSSIASIEYAVAHLPGDKVLVVLGHSKCGAVKAALDAIENRKNNGHNLNHLLAHIVPAVAASPAGTPENDVVKTNAKLTVEELQNRSSIIKNAVDAGNLKIVPAYYNLTNGKVDFLTEEVS